MIYLYHSRPHTDANVWLVTVGLSVASVAKASCRLLVCNEEGGVKGCCLRCCEFVQSGTVSVQPHPCFGLVVISALFCDPPAPPSGWGGRVTLSVCLRVLFSAPKLEDRSSWSSHRPYPNPRVPTPFSHPFSKSTLKQLLLAKTLSNPWWAEASSWCFLTGLMNEIIYSISNPNTCNKLYSEVVAKFDSDDDLNIFFKSPYIFPYLNWSFFPWIFGSVYIIVTTWMELLKLFF